MAAAGTFVGTFPSSITSCNVISWSNDNRIAIAADGGLFVLDLVISPTHADAACHFHHSNIPPSKDEAVRFVVYDFNKFSKSLSTDEVHQLMLDRTLCPRTSCQTSSKGYKTAAWSPCGGDIAGRSVLASISHDHQVYIHTSSDTLKTWTQVVDISNIYASKNSYTGDLTFSILQQQTYKLAAMELSWSDIFQGKDDNGMFNYSLLAVAMKNGDIVLWKIRLPCTQECDCTIAKVLSLHTSIPTSLSWCPLGEDDDRGILAVGYSSGVIHILDIRMDDEVKVRPNCIYGDSDNLRVSCMCWKKLRSGSYLLLSSKEQFLIAHQVKPDNKLNFTQKAMVTGGHWMAGSGLSSRERLTVLGSTDGLVQKVSVTEMKNKHEEIVLDMCRIQFPRDDKYSWTCHGVTLSPNGCFCAAVFMPSSSFCHLEMREPIKVQVIHVGDTEFIHEYAGSLSHAGDVYEAYRQGICCEVDLLDLLKEHRLNVTDLNEQPLKALRIYRFLFLTLDNLLRNSSEQKEENFVPISKDVEKFSVEIHGRLIKQRFESVIKKKGNLTQCEQKILAQMYQWLENSPSESHQSFSRSDICLKVMGYVKDKAPPSCCICQGSLQLSHSSCQCINGHSFGACCWSMLPCDQVPYRKCLTCGTLALQIDNLKDIQWLASDLTRCTLCEGQLL